MIASGQRRRLFRNQAIPGWREFVPTGASSFSHTRPGVAMVVVHYGDGPASGAGSFLGTAVQQWRTVASNHHSGTYRSMQRFRGGPRNRLAGRTPVSNCQRCGVFSGMKPPCRRQAIVAGGPGGPPDHPAVLDCVKPLLVNWYAVSLRAQRSNLRGREAIASLRALLAMTACPWCFHKPYSGPCEAPVEVRRRPP